MNAPKLQKPATNNSATKAKVDRHDVGQLDLFAVSCPAPNSSAEGAELAGMPDEATLSAPGASDSVPTPTGQHLATGKETEPEPVDGEPVGVEEGKDNLGGEAPSLGGVPISGDGCAARAEPEFGGKSGERPGVHPDYDRAGTPEGEKRVLTGSDEGHTDVAKDNDFRDIGTGGTFDGAASPESGASRKSVAADSPVGVEDPSATSSNPEERPPSDALGAESDQSGISVSRAEVPAGPATPEAAAALVKPDGERPSGDEAVVDGPERALAATGATAQAISGDPDGSLPERAALGAESPNNGGNVSIPDKRDDDPEPPSMDNPDEKLNTVSGDQISGSGGRDGNASDSTHTTSGADAHDRSGNESIGGRTKSPASKPKPSRKNRGAGAGSGKPESQRAKPPGKKDIPATNGKDAKGTISAEAQWRRDHPEYGRLEVWLLRTDIARFKSRVKASGMRGQEALESLVHQFLESDGDQQNPPRNRQPPSAHDISGDD
ncbi:MAG: hypothetical protein IAE82_08815 [Opitutaceae bacterium]|nr:hypothetical protein [Opitutaceae bacterium]